MDSVRSYRIQIHATRKAPRSRANLPISLTWCKFFALTTVLKPNLTPAFFRILEITPVSLKMFGRPLRNPIIVSLSTPSRGSVTLSRVSFILSISTFALEPRPLNKILASSRKPVPTVSSFVRYSRSFSPTSVLYISG